MMWVIADIEHIQVVDFDLIEILSPDCAKFLLIFDDSLDDLSELEKVNAIATAGRHTI